MNLTMNHGVKEKIKCFMENVIFGKIVKFQRVQLLAYVG